jgi:hypothetical protein
MAVSCAAASGPWHATHLGILLSVHLSAAALA